MVKKLVWFVNIALVAAACGRAPADRQPSPIAAPQPSPIPSSISEVRDAESSGHHQAALAGLEKLARSPDPVERRRALTMLGLAYEQDRRLGQALDTLKEAVSYSPEIGPYLRLRQAGVLRKMGRPLDAASIAAGVIRSAPGTTASNIATIELPGLYALAGSRDLAETSLEATAAIRLNSLNEGDFMEMADTVESAGWPDLADRVRMRMIAEFPQSRFAEKLYARLYQDPGRKSPLETMPFADALGLADRLGRYNRYDQALDLLERIARRYPQESADPTLRYVRLVSLFNSRHYEQAASLTFQEGDPYYLASELRRARAFWRIDRNADFLAILERLTARYPKTSEAAAARVLLSKYYVTDDTDYTRSAALLKEAIAGGAMGNDGENLWTLGWIYTLAGADGDALATFTSYLKKYPDSDYTSNCLFWAARIHQRNGRMETRDELLRRLIRTYPYSNYSYRAREILGEPPLAPSTVESGYAFPADQVAAASADPILDPVRELLEVGLANEAAREMQRLAEERTGDAVFAYHLADLYAQAGEPLKANILLQRNFRDIVRHGGSAVPQRFWEILYPRQYWDSIVEAARRSGVDPFLVTAIIRQESGFDPTIVSSAGAVGLMQIMPGEASRIASDGGLPPPAREELFLPEKNVQIGAAEIQQKIRAMNGNMMLGIAAYNAGEGAVGRWIARTSPEDVDLFIESIPFSETRLYVKIVTRNLYEYRRVYGSS